MKNNKNIILLIAAVVVAIAAVISIVVPKLTNKGSEINPSGYEQNTVNNESSTTGIVTDNIVIDESAVSKTASFYDYDADGITIEVFAVRASDNTIRTALNTCQICCGSPYAYFLQQDDYFICQNCNNSFSVDDIGIAHGGCNPVPITQNDYITENGNIIIPKQFLEQYRDDFSNWKKF